MTRFMGYDNGEYENRNYAIYDLSKSEKTKEDFWNNENDCYDIWAFMDYLEENDCILSCDKVVELLNEQQATINKLNDELELTANTKLYSRRELERKVDEQQAEIERLQKIIDLTQYQLKNKLNKGL